jgi:hypothetical protein
VLVCNASSNVLDSHWICMCRSRSLKLYQEFTVQLWSVLVFFYDCGKSLTTAVRRAPALGNFPRWLQSFNLPYTYGTDSFSWSSTQILLFRSWILELPSPMSWLRWPWQYWYGTVYVPAPIWFTNIVLVVKIPHTTCSNGFCH